MISLWYKKLSLYVRLWRISKSATTLSHYKPNRQLCENLFTELHPHLYENYTPSTGLSVFISVYYENIESYTQKLKELSRQLMTDKPIAPDWGGQSETSISVDRFLTTSDGFYTDVQKALVDFKEAGLQLCALMRESDTAAYGLHEHNLRMLTKLFINLRAVLVQLIEVSLTNSRHW